MDSLTQLLNILTSLFTLVAGSLAALWAYTKYVVERGLLPPVQFDVTCNKIGMYQKRNILEFEIHLRNVGSTTLVAQNIRIDVRYIRTGDLDRRTEGPDIELFKEHLFTDNKRAGRLYFPNSLIQELNIDPSSLIPRKIRNDQDRKELWIKRGYLKRGFLILEYDTFVQPGVDQKYTFVTTVPGDTLCALTWCSFQYAQQLSSGQERILKISRRLGLIQYSLQHVQEPHTVESVFWLVDNAQLKKSAGAKAV